MNTMDHLDEEQLTLHYYGDSDDQAAVTSHLAACADCRAQYARIQAFLGAMPASAVPEPPADYEQQLWLNLRRQLPAKRAPWWKTLFAWPRLAPVAAVAALVVAAFFLGRISKPVTPNVATGTTANPERIVLVAVGNHLERSQMFLVELMAADPKDPAELSEQQTQARDLLRDNRLYRESAARTEDPAIQNVLDQLERVLVEVANSPEQVSADDVRDLQRQVQSQGLLFKVRVLGGKVRSMEKAQTKPAGVKGT